MIIGIGANISESAIVQSSKSLDGIKTVCENFDKSAGIHADSVHHTIPQNLQRKIKNLW